ncbi:hypothetical protein SPOG_05254, partial [Schizosaccharomyces cryophilus OY26]
CYLPPSPRSLLYLVFSILLVYTPSRPTLTNHHHPLPLFFTTNTMTFPIIFFCTFLTHLIQTPLLLHFPFLTSTAHPYPAIFSHCTSPSSLHPTLPLTPTFYLTSTIHTFLSHLPPSIQSYSFLLHPTLSPSLHYPLIHIKSRYFLHILTSSSLYLLTRLVLPFYLPNPPLLRSPTSNETIISLNTFTTLTNYNTFTRLTQH